MATTITRNGHSPGEEEPLARLTQLASVVLEAAQQLQATAAVAARREEAGARASRGELTAALIADLLADDALDGSEVSRRAADLGCDLSLGALVLCVELRVRRPTFVVALIAEGCEAALTGATASGRVYAILPCVATCIAGSAGAARQLADRLSPYGVVGVSSYQADTSRLGRALREAELVVELTRNSAQPAAEDIGRGTYRLLLRLMASNPVEVRDFYISTVAPIVEHDRHGGTELVTTLQAYLDADCNMNLTAATVAAHRHTVAARLERIHQLTGLDPLRSQGREQLGLGLKAYRLLAPQLGVGPI